MPKLQPLRIPAGWEVVLNKFSEIDIEDWPEDNIGIDLGWYPDTDPQGAFHVKVILDENWEKPVREYVTRERKL